MEEKIRLIRKTVKEIDPNPEWYPGCTTIEQMAEAEISIDNRELIFMDALSDTITYEIIDSKGRPYDYDQIMVLKELENWLTEAYSSTGLLHASKPADDPEAIRLLSKQRTFKLVHDKLEEFKKQFRESGDGHE